VSERKKALVVDDIEANRNMLKTFLYFAHFDIELAADGLEAKKLLETKSFDLLITDIEMPNMNGFELLAWAKKSPSAAKTPVIVLSSLDTPEVAERCRKLGAADYIVKPFSKEKVDAALAKAGF
jgi:CheY-like chemotaxis protein